MMTPYDKNFVGPLHHAGGIVAKRGIGKVHPFVKQVMTRDDGTSTYFWTPLCSCPGTANGSAKPHTFFPFNNANCGN